MYNKRRRPQAKVKICPRQSTRCKKITPSLEFTYNLRSKTNDVAHLSTGNNKNDCCIEPTQTILRRSKRIHQKNHNVKIYDCVSDFYMQTQKGVDSVFQKINKKYVQATTNVTFCEVLEKQLLRVHTAHVTTRCVQTIKSLVANIDALLESDDRMKHEPASKNLNFFTLKDRPFRLESIYKDENVFDVTECTIPSAFSSDTSNDCSVALERCDETFSFDEDVFLPTMPDLKNPSPLKFYPRIMHNI